MDSLKRLVKTVKRKVGEKTFVIASHSEPYIHYFEEGEVKWRKASGGLVTALDPLMRACGGTWVAYAAGDADAEVVDGQGRLKVPPGEKKYDLKRLFLNKDDVSKYLDGVAHSSLWPWCHFAYVRPAFDDGRWPVYQKVNKMFADSVIEAIGKEKGFVWLQDYHLALAAKYIKEKRPDIVTAHFWHVPWPNSEIFKICPWGREILESMLYNDLIGFQIPYYASNFMDSIDHTLQARVDREHSTVFYRESQTVVKAFPISIDYRQLRDVSRRVSDANIKAMKRRLGLSSEKILIGIDRLDYSKGLAEKLRILDEFFNQNPEWVKKVTLVQVASPTRAQVSAYKSNAEKVFALMEEINYRWGTGKWKPVVSLNRFLKYEEIVALYKMADCCLVTPLHDGMNLVSKEYVIAKEDGRGVLLLSKFTGSSRDLKQAVLINPYAIAETAKTLKCALEMPIKERRMRMVKLRQEIQDNDIYKWAADFIENITKLESTVV